jgi:curved DNA-binding protein
MKKLDYYEFLQISPNAEEETIHRVYRFLAARYHPDNPVSGNPEQFATLTQAYEVLSNPARRAQYDTERQREQDEVTPLSSTIDFMDQFEGETNRRLALLALLYYRRRENPNRPEVPLAEVETRMGFPRDYLDFTTWYLQKKGYITKADNSDFALTADGVDFVETQRAQVPILNRLLTTGTAPPVPVKSGASSETGESESDKAESAKKSLGRARKGERRTTKEDRRVAPVERRLSAGDRREGKPDWRSNPIERRVNIVDRRRTTSDRRIHEADRRAGDSGHGAHAKEEPPANES